MLIQIDSPQDYYQTNLNRYQPSSMYSETVSVPTKTPGPNEEIEVTIRNLPNEATVEQIISYLEMSGPIKSHKFLREQQRYSAQVIYHDNESAEICRKYLGDRYFKGRALTITTELKKNYQATTPVHGQGEDELLKLTGNLKRDEKRVLLGLMKSMRSEGKIFQMFLESRPKLVEALLMKPQSMDRN